MLPFLCWFLDLAAWTGTHRLHLPSVIGRSAIFFVGGAARQAAVAPIPGDEGHYAQWLPGTCPGSRRRRAFAAVSASPCAAPADTTARATGNDPVGCWDPATAGFATRRRRSPDPAPRSPRQLRLVRRVLYAVAAVSLPPGLWSPEREGWTDPILSACASFLQG